MTISVILDKQRQGFNQQLKDWEEDHLLDTINHIYNLLIVDLSTEEQIRNISNKNLSIKYVMHSFNNWSNVW